jgi:hypothetical protein
MKSIITILLLGLLTSSQCQSLDANYSWIATESSQIKKDGWISPIDGMILKFDNKQLIMSHIFYDSIRYYPLEIKKEKIYLKDSLWSEIRHLDDDSLILDFNKMMRVKFIPISRGTYSRMDLNYWDFTDWTFKYNEYFQEFKLLDSLWSIYPNELAKICVTQSKGERYRYSQTEKWNIKVINEKHIFAITFGQFDYKIYNVLEYKGDTVFLESLTDQESALILLIKEPVLTPDEKDRIINILRNQRFYTAELIDKVNSFEEDSLDWEFEPTGFFVIDTTLFKKISLLNNQLSFEFSDNMDYKIYESDTLRINGKWKLSKSGKQIVLNYGFNPNDYIDLIKVETDSIIIGKSDMFQVGERKKDYVDYYYKIVLTK